MSHKLNGEGLIAAREKFAEVIGDAPMVGEVEQIVEAYLSSSAGFPLSLTEEGVRAVLHAMRKTYPDAQEDSVAGRSIAMLEATAEAQAQVVADRVRVLAGREERDG